MILTLGPLLVIACGVLGWWGGCVIGDRIANRRDRAHELAVSRRPSAATLQRLQDDVDVPLDEYVRRHVDRELGLHQRQPMRPDRTVCLTKDCRGDTDELHLWGGQLAYRIHTCRRS